MAGSPEQKDNRGVVENVSTGVRNFGIFAAMIGLLAALVEAPIAGTIFVFGAGTGVVGEAGRIAAGSGKK